MAFEVAELLGTPLEAYTPGRMTYDLRGLRLHGLIVRIPHTQRHDITPLGRRVALFSTKLHARLIRPGLTQLFDGCPRRRTDRWRRPSTDSTAPLSTSSPRPNLPHET